MSVNIDAVSRLIRDVAATEIMPRFDRLAAGEIEEKGPGDLVTVADRAAELRLGPALAELLPGSVVVGEEAAASDPGILARLSGEAPVWVIDPVDGTANFAAGIPLFGVMVGLIRRGSVVAGWIWDAPGQRMAIAEAGAGARLNGRRLEVAPAREPERMSGILTFRTGERTLAETVARNTPKVASHLSLRCVAHEYLLLAEGRIHFAHYNRTFPWDHAPGWLLHKEAGGFGRRLDGSPYDPAVIHGPILFAPDPESWQRLKATLFAT
ncbi:MAG: inositol monophosphatase [Proteobacteria bacterium]|nr:inositol monophosphatase [Pseudomonadota bacterium]MBI3496071.1 inositol monophosphatase [Pseudomonadota bacterium]